MFPLLGQIVDDLYDTLRSGKPTAKHVIFVVGNGIHPVNNILNDSELRKKARPGMSAAEFDAFKWRHFEFARYWTSNALPSFAHFCIRQLAKDDLCRDIITTNYDLFFDGLWERTPSLAVAQNPVREPLEYDWDSYYSARPTTVGSPRYWKIHGSLSHVCFRQTVPPYLHHIHRLPRFAVSINNEDLASAYRIPSQAPVMNYEATKYLRTDFARPDEISGPFEPFIDWTYSNDRTR